MGENQTGNYARKEVKLMPIKWSAVKVSKAMDGVERQVTLAESFLAEAKAKVTEARGIPNLPEYMDGRLNRVITQLERIDYVKSAIEAVRNAIPDGAIEEEQKNARHGTTQSLI